MKRVIAVIAALSITSATAQEMKGFKTIKDSAVWVSYDEIARYPQRYLGELVRLRGKVRIAHYTDQTSAQFIVHTALDGKEYWSGSIVVRYQPAVRPQERVLENDIVEFWGTFIGFSKPVDYPIISASEIYRVK